VAATVTVAGVVAADKAGPSAAKIRQKKTSAAATMMMEKDDNNKNNNISVRETLTLNS
jgi:hypothetical protein